MITCTVEAVPIAGSIGTGCRNRHLKAAIAPLTGNIALKIAGNCAYVSVEYSVQVGRRWAVCLYIGLL